MSTSGCHFCGKTGHFVRDCPQKERTIKAERSGGKVFVGNLRRSVGKDEMEDVFGQFGEVLFIWLARDPPGFAFVTYADEDDARKACDKLHGREKDFTESGGMRVEMATSTGPRPRGDRGRSRSRSRSYSRRRRRDNSRSRNRSRDRRDRGRRRDSRSRSRSRRR